MGFGLFLAEALSGTGWQLYVPHFAQILCTMSFRTRKLVDVRCAQLTAHVITIVMCTLSFAEIHAGQGLTIGIRTAPIVLFCKCGAPLGFQQTTKSAHYYSNDMGRHLGK